MRYYAHTLDNQPKERWQLLEDHLKGVAGRASEFAAAFGSGEWGRLAGLWHDLGKYQPAFQNMLETGRGSVEHSGVGAALAATRGSDGLAMSFVIAAHHKGLPNLRIVSPNAGSPLMHTVETNRPHLDSLNAVVPAEIWAEQLPPLPAFLRMMSRNRVGPEKLRQSELWVRFLFSTLVDADRLDTEAFAHPQEARQRGRFASLSELSDKLDAYIEQVVQNADANTSVNKARALVLESCRTAAALPPGIFGLLVPTGGGKTLSAMSFGMRHAARHGLRRLIVVIPYTSIIEQNASVYRRALGAENVIEHHTAFEPKEELTGEKLARHELAAENWDATVIVTTTVQFLESLFSNRSSRCRKLHNVARSVVILDEVQSLPVGFLLPIVEVLSSLVESFGCTVLLSTATTPALEARTGFLEGLQRVRRVVSEPQELFHRLRRVRYQWPDPDGRPMEWEELVERVASRERVLVVVHRRADARELAQLVENRLGGHGQVHHLSALMCPAHRSKVIEEVRSLLAEEKPCRVVSTQLIEAGVDVDFPVVFRALCGLDSIVQAAGRCNREGRLRHGEVFIFRAPTKPPPGVLRAGLEATEALLRESEGELDPDDPDTIERYFRYLYFTQPLDSAGIQMEREQFNFVETGRKFHVIEDEFTATIVVPYGEGEARLQEVRKHPERRELLRALQRFSVSVYPDALARMEAAGALEEISPGLYALSAPFKHLYDARFGLVVGDEVRPDPTMLVV